MSLHADGIVKDFKASVTFFEFIVGSDELVGVITENIPDGDRLGVVINTTLTVNHYFTLVSFNVRFPTFATDLNAFIVMPCFASELVGVITGNIPNGDRLGVVVTRLTLLKLIVFLRFPSVNTTV